MDCIFENATTCISLNANGLSRLILNRVYLYGTSTNGISVLAGELKSHGVVMDNSASIVTAVSAVGPNSTISMFDLEIRSTELTTAVFADYSASITLLGGKISGSGDTTAFKFGTTTSSQTIIQVGLIKIDGCGTHLDAGSLSSADDGIFSMMASAALSRMPA